MPRQRGGIEITVNGVRLPVVPELEAAVRRAYQASLRPLPREMTTTQAAEFLDVSRPFIIKLINRGELPCRLVGSHRRIPSAAVREYREKMFQQARNAADEMSPGTRQSRPVSRRPGTTVTVSSSTRTSPPNADSIRSVWSRLRAGSTTVTGPEAERPASRIDDLTWALATFET